MWIRRADQDYISRVENVDLFEFTIDIALHLDDHTALQIVCDCEALLRRRNTNGRFRWRATKVQQRVASQNSSAWIADPVQIFDAPVRGTGFDAGSCSNYFVLTVFRGAAHLIDNDRLPGIVKNSHAHTLLGRINRAVGPFRASHLGEYRQTQQRGKEYSDETKQCQTASASHLLGTTEGGLIGSAPVGSAD